MEVEHKLTDSRLLEMLCCCPFGTAEQAKVLYRCAFVTILIKRRVSQSDYQGTCGESPSGHSFRCIVVVDLRVNKNLYIYYMNFFLDLTCFVVAKG